MGKINFTNPDSKKTFTLNLDANMIFIYGGNGSGKTTLSRSFKSEKYMVFNTDFINQNVYIIKSSGADVDTDTKENFTSLFLGEEAVQLAKEVESLTLGKKEKEKLLIKEFSEVKDKISKEGLIPFIKVDDIAKEVSYVFSFDSEINFESNKSKFKINQFLPTTIVNDTQYTEQLKIYKEDNTINNLNKEIEHNIDLSNLIKDKKNIIDLEDIKKYNLTTDELIKLETSFNKGSSPKDVKNWLELGIKLHENEDNCIFCGSDNVQEKIEKWKEKLQNALIKQKSDLMKQLEGIKNSIDIIFKNKDLYNNIVPKILKTTSDIRLILEEYIKAINQSKKIEIKEVSIEVDLIQQDRSDMHTSLRNFYANKIIDKVLYVYAYSKEYEKYAKTQNQKSEKLNLIYATDTAKNINEISKLLGFTKDISVNLERRGNMPKIALQSADKNIKISSYSEGQRHKLALAIFFSKYLMSDKKIEALVLDDPVITLDVQAYHALKQILKDESYQKANRIIITTHNIHYLYVQMSNILESESLQRITKLYEITSKDFKEVPIYILKSDDLSLYTRYINTIQDYNQLDKIYWLTSKIARYFLDFRLRFRGIMSIQNMSLEIPLLDISEEDKSKLQTSFNSLSRTCSKPTVKVEEVILSFDHLNNIMLILGFPLVISKENIDKFNPYKEKVIKNNDETSNIIEEILTFGRKIHFNDGSNKVIKEMKNYIDHPRNQITESILVLKASQDI